MTVRAPVTDDFVYNWLTTGKVAHLCVDNQAFFTSPTFHGNDAKLHNGQQNFGIRLSRITQAHRDRFRPVHVMMALGTQEVDRLRDENFRIDRIQYDPATFSAAKVPDHKGNQWVDLITPSYEMDWVHVKEKGVWGRSRGERLKEKLFADDCGKFIASGAFAELCVDDAVSGGIKNGFDVIVDPNMVWSGYKGATMTKEACCALYNEKAIITEPGQVINVMKQIRLTA